MGWRVIDYPNLQTEKANIENSYNDYKDSTAAVIVGLTNAAAMDSLNFENQKKSYQNTIAEMRTKEKNAVSTLKLCEEEKQKIIRGELCPESYGLFKKKIRLVPCK